MKQSGHNSPRRILVRGVNWLGDAVMTTPALLRLREAHPGAHIALLTLDKLAGLWEGHPALNEVIPFRKSDGIAGVRKLIAPQQFDLALVLPNSFRSALEIWLSGIPLRIGHGGSGRGLLLNRVVPRRAEEVRMHKRSDAEVQRLIAEPGRSRESFPAAAHQVYNYLHLAAAAGAGSDPLPPHLHVSDAEKSAFRARFSLGDGLLLGLNPGAEYGPAKRWPPERFVSAALASSRQVPGIHWLLFGGPADVETTRWIEGRLRESALNVINVAGQTSLRELCAGLASCRVVLTNDTGPMHLAAALGARVVVPFGSTSPELTGPGLPGGTSHQLIRGHAPCAPCFRRECPIDFRCMTSIAPDQIAQAIVAATA